MIGPRATLVAITTALAVLCSQSAPALLSQDADPQVTFRIIVVSSEDAAQRIAQQVAEGANFVSLAGAESIDPSASGGGLIGPIALSALRPEMRSVLEGLQPGRISPVVRVPLGYAVVQIVPSSSAAGLSGTTDVPGLAAAGAVRSTLSVDGLGEAETALNNFIKPADWNQDPRTICQMRQESVASVLESLAAVLTPGNPTLQDASPLDVIEVYIAHANLYAFDGRMREAIAQFEQALRLAEAQYVALVPQVVEMLGIAYFHQAEIDNGVYHKPGDRCLLSGRPSERFARTADLEKAIGYFMRALAGNPDDLEVKWLLNVAHMVSGGYPASVPARFLIDRSAFESGEDAGRFVDVAPALGLDTVASAGGVIVDDFDNDGRLDIVSSNSATCGAMHLFGRSETGAFVDRAAAAFAGQLGGLNLSQADYDNDGCRDVLVMRGGWQLPQRRSLLRNNCDGTFTDVTVAAGLARPATASQAAVWADVDNDGFVDLFVGNESAPAQLFRNRGNGTFEDIAASAGVNATAFTKGVAAADYDNDGLVDLYVSNLGGGNFLYRNDGNLRFTELSRAAGVHTADRGFPTWFFDYDNDGRDDLFVSSYYQSVEESAKTYLRLPFNASGMKLYRNLGDGGFRNVAREVGLDKPWMPMGSNFGDIDNDGFLDLYLGTGSPSYGALVPSVLLRNREGRQFVDVTLTSGTGELHKGHGVAFADLDNDGDQEIVFEVGGATPGDAHAFRLFENPGHGNDWLGLHLIGVRTNRAAIGARIAVTVEDERGMRRSIHRTVNSGGSFGASPLQQHVGLGRGAKAVDVEVYWPVSRTRQRFAGVPKNQVLEIRELDDRFATLSRPPLPLRRP
jgi:tetratricopeptide (TPR) repeat protein